MEPPAFATPSDYFARHGEGADEARVGVLLGDASELIRTEAKVTWIDEETGELTDDVPYLLVGIACTVVNRKLTNPDGVTSQMTAPAGYSESTSFANASPDMYLTRSEKRFIRRAAGVSGFRSVQLESGHIPPGRQLPNAEDFRSSSTGGDDIPMGPFLP